MGFKDIRRAFVFKDDVIWLQDDADTRDCKQWCQEDLGWDQEKWSTATRGYMTIARIVFFTGDNYEPDERVTNKKVVRARQAHLMAYGRDVDNRIYNGVVPGVHSAMWNIILEYSRVGVWYTSSCPNKGYFVEEIAEVFNKHTRQEITDTYLGFVLEDMLCTLQKDRLTASMSKASVVAAIAQCLRERKFLV